MASESRGLALRPAPAQRLPDFRSRRTVYADEWRCRCAAGHCAEAHESVFTEHEDRWILGLRGLAVTRISVDCQLSLLPGAECWVVLEGTCRLSRGPAGSDGPQEVLDPGRQDVAAALALFGAKILSAVAFKTGSLRLVFDNGQQLSCRADPSFEASLIS